MRAIVLKLFCWLCVAATTTNILAYQNTNSNSKTAYIQSEWADKINTKDNNRYAALLMGSSSTTYKPPWPTHSENNKHPHRSSYSYINYNNNNNAVRVRHSRYPNLDGVMTRLNKIHTTTKMPTTTAPPLLKHHRYDNSKTFDKLFYESYDDTDDLDYEDEDPDDDSAEIDNDDLPDYDNWGTEDENGNLKNEADEDEEDDFNDDDDEEEDDDNGDDGWQAEEATESAPSSLTEYKWQHYGTRTRVEESRRNQYPERSSNYAAVDQAIQHTLRMDKESRCKNPLPRVLSVQKEHPDPAKTYMPHCTVLHRCAEDTGCCPNHAERCSMKSQQLVHLYFYTRTVGVPGSKVEKLAFYNHTECACLDRTLEPTAAEDSTPQVSRPYRSNLSVRAAETTLYSPPQTIRRCKCPEEYTPHVHRGAYCSCDCDEGNVDCATMKRGKEFFSLKDRLCIINGECGYPLCEYGGYMRNVGRCPRKQEKLDAFASVTDIN